MKHPEKTMREVIELIGNSSSSPVFAIMNEKAVERAQTLGILDTKMKDIPTGKRMLWKVGLINDALATIGMFPGGQIAVFILLSMIFLPVYYVLTR